MERYLSIEKLNESKLSHEELICIHLADLFEYKEEADMYWDNHGAYAYYRKCIFSDTGETYMFMYCVDFRKDKILYELPKDRKLRNRIKNKLEL